MSIEDILTVLLGMVVVCGIAAAANYAEREQNGRLRNFVMGSLLILGFVIILFMGAQVLAAYAASETTDPDSPQRADAWGAFWIAVVTGGGVTALAFRPVRERIAIVFPRHEKAEPAVPEAAAIPVADGTPLFPQMLNYYTTASEAAPPSVPAQSAERGYNPYSVVHTAALMLSLYFLSIQFIGFVLSGGLEGVAEDYSAGVSAWDILLNGLPQIIIPIIGVGFGLRRTLSQTLRRLGLEIPTLEQLAIGFGTVVVLFVFIIIVTLIWQALVSEETFEDQSQASRALADSIGTLWMAFLIALMAGVGEEIAFRGALQPVFGLWPTSILFALFHMQYTLTPAALIILGVAVAFGWLRRKYNTTLAILAHFLYNFVQLAVAVSIPEDAASWIMRLI